MKDCVFCKISKGEIPSYKVYEDDDFLGILDIRPMTKGHCQIIPKKHYRWTYDVPNFGEYFEVAKKVGVAAKEAFGAEWLSFLTIGHEIDHAHIWVMPRYSNDKHGDVIDLSKSESFSEEEMEQIAQKIKSVIDE